MSLHEKKNTHEWGQKFSNLSIYTKQREVILEEFVKIESSLLVPRRNCWWFGGWWLLVWSFCSRIWACGGDLKMAFSVNVHRVLVLFPGGRDTKPLYVVNKHFAVTVGGCCNIRLHSI